MNAQTLYYFRERTEFCSGADLQNWFYSQVEEMSPSGRVEIDAHEASQFVRKQLSSMATRNPSQEFAIECQQQIFDFAMMAYPARVTAELRAAGATARGVRSEVDDTIYYSISVDGKPFAQVAYNTNGYNEMGSHRF